MKSKIRFIATMISLVTTLLVLVLVLPISIYAARQANVSGSGSLNFVPPAVQDDDLESLGFHATGGGDNTITLGSMEEPSGDIAGLKAKAIQNNVLRYELYRKIDCSNASNYVYELAVVVDFSNYNIRTYSRFCLQYYNQIAFNCTNGLLFSEQPLYDFYSGEIIDYVNVSVVASMIESANLYGYDISLKSTQNAYEYPRDSVKYVYRIILNNYYNNSGELDNIVLNNRCFKWYDDRNLTENQIVTYQSSNIEPAIVYLDFSNMKFDKPKTEEDGGNFELIGIDLGSDGFRVDLTNNKHIHIIGKSDIQHEAGLVMAEKYISNQTEYEISIYGNTAIHKYSILCKIKNDDKVANYVNITVVDAASYESSSLNDTQRKAITNMCFWLSKNEISDALIYHQKIDSNMAFAGDPIQVAYRESTSDTHPASNWYEVYYVDNDDVINNEIIIGYFDANVIDVNVTTN